VFVPVLASEVRAFAAKSHAREWAAGSRVASTPGRAAAWSWNNPLLTSDFRLAASSAGRPVNVVTRSTHPSMTLRLLDGLRKK
jgi:hypothetical protein